MSPATSPPKSEAAEQLVGWLAAIRLDDFAFPVEYGPPRSGAEEWRRWGDAVGPEGVAARLERLERSVGPRCPPGLAAAWDAERTAWFLGVAVLGSAIGLRTVPTLSADGIWVRSGDDGLVDRLALDPADLRHLGAGGAPAAVLIDLLEDLIAELGRHRPARTLWRHAGDRLAEAALWVGTVLGEIPAALEVVEAVQADEPRLTVPPRFGELDEEPWRLRWTCCLARRVPEYPTCRACPLHALDSARGTAQG